MPEIEQQQKIPAAKYLKTILKPVKVNHKPPKVKPNRMKKESDFDVDAYFKRLPKSKLFDMLKAK